MSPEPNFTMVGRTDFAASYRVNEDAIEVYNNGHLGHHLYASLTKDTRCGTCCNLLGEGVKVSALLAENPADAVWTHDECPGSAALGVEGKQP